MFWENFWSSICWTLSPGQEALALKPQAVKGLGMVGGTDQAKAWEVGEPSHPKAL